MPHAQGRQCSIGIELVNSFYKKVDIVCSSVVHLETDNRFFTTFVE